MMILICGATGKVASEVVNELAGTGLRVRAMVHYVYKAFLVGQPGVEVVQASYEQPETLDQALEGVEKVYLVARPGRRQVEQETHVIEAAARAGVQHIVKQSILNAGPDSPVHFCAWNGRIEQNLIESGVPYTILQPNFFLQNLLQFAGPVVNEGVLALPMGEARVSMIDVRDVAAVAVEILTSGGHIMERHVLTGPHALSFGEVAAQLSAALGREVVYRALSPGEARLGLLATGRPEWYVKASLELAESYVLGAGAVVTNEVEEITGHAACTFRRFAKDYREVFLQGARGEEQRAA